jgi:hypothetical protein
VSSRGKTEIRIIDKGTKVNSEYYINKVFKLFLEKDVPRLFPEGANAMTFHQDSASSHTSKRTLSFLKDRQINFITPEEYVPKSPDTIPMDFGIRAVLKRRLQTRQINTLVGLKMALKDEWRNLDQETIKKTLKSWPKRCRMIYNCHGSYIEHLLK